jgi:hypothetical protein
MTSSDPAAEFAARSAANAAAEAERLRLEIEHRDQMLAAVYARADGLQREIERLERQLEAALEAQREAATERAELRRLLGNAQMQVHSLLRIAPPTPDGERLEGPAAAQPPPPDGEPAQPAAARADSAPGRRVVDERAEPPRPRPIEPEPEAQADDTPQPEPAPAAPRAPEQSRGIVEDAREAWSSLRKLF